MKRGPKPKMPAACSCGKVCQLKRGYCHTCYCRKLKSGELQKLEHKELPQCLTHRQTQYLTGSLLGDGCLFKHKPTHKPYFAVQRQKLDEEYNRWEVDMLGEFVCKAYDGVSYDKRTEKHYEWVKLRTHRTDVFESFYVAWYPQGKKIVPADLELSPLSLAVWFADDGYVRDIENGRLQIKLSTHGFDLQSVELLTSLLASRYNEYFGITLDQDKPIIYASDSGAWAFCKEIIPVFPLAMRRKMTWSHMEEKPKTVNKAEHLRKTYNGRREKN